MYISRYRSRAIETERNKNYSSTLIELVEKKDYKQAAIYCFNQGLDYLFEDMVTRLNKREKKQIRNLINAYNEQHKDDEFPF